MTLPRFVIDSKVAPALTALREAAVHPIGGAEEACADSTAALWVHYAVVSTLKSGTAEDMVRALQLLNTAAAVIAAHLGAGPAPVCLPALRSTAWVDGMQRVFQHPKYAAPLSRSLKDGMGVYRAIESDLALLAERPGGAA